MTAPRFMVRWTYLRPLDRPDGFGETVLRVLRATDPTLRGWRADQTPESVAAYYRMGVGPATSWMIRPDAPPSLPPDSLPPGRVAPWGPWREVPLSEVIGPAIADHAAALAVTSDELREAEPLELLALVAELWTQIVRYDPEGLPAAWVHGLARKVAVGSDGATAPSDQVDGLTRALMRELPKLRDALELTPEGVARRGWTEEDGALWLDRAMVDVDRRRFGDQAVATDGGPERWRQHQAGKATPADVLRRWLDPDHDGPIPGPVVSTVARLVWGEVREKLERERAELERLRRPVALAVGVLELVSAPLRATGIDRATDGREWLTRARANAPAELLAVWQHPTVAVQDAGRLLALARDGVRGLVTVNGPRLVYWLAREAWLQIQRGGDAAPLVFEGGAGGNAWATLAREVGAPDDREGARAMGAIVAALGATLLALDTKEGRQEGNLLTYHYRQAGHGRGSVSRLELTPGWPFKLNAAELRGKEAAVSALAPLPPLTGNLPPMPGTLRRNDHAAGARLWLAVLAELARQNQPISAGDGAHLPGSRLAALAVELGVKRPEPLVLGSGVLELWTRDGEHGPALLERVGEDRYHLGPAFPEERRLLEEGGRHREGQAERGEIATRKRAAKAAKAAQHREKRKGNT